MSALASSPEFSLSPSSESSEPPPQQSSAPKRKKRQNFSGLTPQQKIVAKKANNRQAAQNLRDRKKQQEVDLERKLQGIEETNARLAAKLAQLEEENRAIQSEALSFANQHIERFQLQGMAQRLMSAVQADPGNGSSISALLAAMGSAMDTSVNISPVPEAAPAPALNLVDPLLDMAASPALSWSPAPLSLDEFDLSPAAALDTSPAPAAAAAAAGAGETSRAAGGGVGTVPPTSSSFQYTLVCSDSASGRRIFTKRWSGRWRSWSSQAEHRSKSGQNMHL
eukprot:m.29321 g.29321  ORF g.29321 m.29321 type:complete len:281 (+) comp9149_c0_seq6:132-974(+)